MKTYRKKPVVVNAVQWDGSIVGATEIIDWILSQPGNRTARYVDYDTNSSPYIAIDTLEGTMNADTDDWVIRGIAGEFYPCKPDIFADLYDEEVEVDPAEKQAAAVTWEFDDDKHRAGTGQHAGPVHHGGSPRGTVPPGRGGGCRDPTDPSHAVSDPPVPAPQTPPPPPPRPSPPSPTPPPPPPPPHPHHPSPSPC